MRNEIEIFFNALMKTAAPRSEQLSNLNPLNIIPNVFGNVVGTMRRPYTDEELRKINKKSHSNMWIPGLGGYRTGRRVNTIGMTEKERQAEKGR
jgi:hypothetical protein